MKIHDVLTPSFRLLHHQLGHDRTGYQYPIWQQRLSSDSDFCRAVVATPEQKQRKIDLIDFLFDSPSLNPET